MRRLGRWVLNAVTVLSLLLCVATCVLWARSYRTSDHITLEGPSQHETRWTSTVGRIIHVGRGGIGYEQLVQRVPAGILLRQIEGPKLWQCQSPWYPDFANRDDEPPEPVSGFRFRRFGALSDDPDDRPSVVGVAAVVPLWLPAAAFASGAVIGVRAWWRRRSGRLRSGFCPSCRYDLTANVSGICPECGKPIAETPAPV